MLKLYLDSYSDDYSWNYNLHWVRFPRVNERTTANNAEVPKLILHSIT